MAGIQVDIVTPNKNVFSGTADQVVAPGWEGEFGILPGHTDFVSLLRAGVVTVLQGSEKKTFVIGRGFAEASAASVVILTDHADTADSVDKAAAKASLDENEAKLGDMSAGSAEYDLVQQRIEQARAELAI